MRTWVDVAFLAHTKNLNGGLVAYAASGLPLLLEEGMEVALVPPVLDAPRRVCVEEAAPRGEREMLVRFAEVTDATTADMLVGCHCLVRRDAIDWEAVAAEDEQLAWTGWQVFDEETGLVGTVSSLEERPLQPLLVVERPEGGTVLIPLAEEFIVDLDEEERCLRLDCPCGLLDL